MAVSASRRDWFLRLFSERTALDVGLYKCPKRHLTVQYTVSLFDGLGGVDSIHHAVGQLAARQGHGQRPKAEVAPKSVL